MRHLLEVTSRAMPGHDADYNDWYDRIHIHEVLALPGFLSCERFVKDAADGGPPDYVAIYEIETDDPQALLQSLFAAAPTMQVTDAIDVSSASFTVLRPAGGGVVKAKA